MAEQTYSTPQLAYVYAASLVKTGNYEEGVKRLLMLEKANAQLADVHTMLGEAYANENNYKDAVRELETSIGINRDDADAYYFLGTVQLEQGDCQKAVSNLETAIRLDPSNPVSHWQLALAYRKELRSQDADRERGIYEALERSHSDK
jgi:Tfp pilus assembly protein PilF